MISVEQILEHLKRLPPEKQIEVMDFINFLQQRSENKAGLKEKSIRHHPAFGIWHQRKLDALKYQEQIRTEWDRDQ